MRVRLLNGKQKELILKAKGQKSWAELANEIKLTKEYLSKDLKNERTLLDEEVYNRLCIISEEDYASQIVEKLPDNWGRCKGGSISNGGRTKNIFMPKRSIELAEFFGIMLGDGNLTVIKRYKVGTYQIRIVGDSRSDKKYLLSYVKPLIKKLFDVDVVIYKPRTQNALCLTATGKKLAEFLLKEGFISGDKIRSQVSIPLWIKENNSYLKYCIRGLIDTDGSVHRMSIRDSNLARINFRNYNATLIKDFRSSLLKLGFHPSKIIHDNIIYLSRQKELYKYLKEIGFSNQKHLDRFNLFVQVSPIE